MDHVGQCETHLGKLEPAPMRDIIFVPHPERRWGLWAVLSQVVLCSASSTVDRPIAEFPDCADAR